MNGLQSFGRDALLLEALSIVAKCKNPKNFWADAMDRLKWILDFTRVDVALRNPDGQTYSLQTVFELRPHVPRILQAAVPLSKGIFGKMMRSGEACQRFNPRILPFASDFIADQGLEGGSLQSILSVSLEANRQMLGVVCFGSLEEDRYCHQDIEVASRFATHAAIVLQNWQHLIKLKEDAKLLDVAADKLQKSHATLESLVEQRTESLRLLSQRLLKSQDEERRKVARDLHDSTGQTLTWLKMSIAKLQRQFADDRSTAGALAALAEIADQALQEIRTTSYLLHPPLLDELGFNSAARWFVEGFAKRSGIRVVLDFPPKFERLPNDVEMVLFRVLQESLTNVHRHSGARDVNIGLERSADLVQLNVQDNGHGMGEDSSDSLRKTNTNSGVGLAGMRERISDLNGQFEVDSSADGTTLRVKIPLASTEQPSDSAQPEVLTRSASAA
jgi:signal transduction histidine kinase